MSASFTALNGLETLEVILSRIRTALVNTGEFKQNIAFPLLRFDYEVKVWGYPKQPLNGEPGIKVTAQVGETEGDVTPTVSASSTAVLDTPDKERLEAGLDIPVASPGGGGVLVDVRTDQPPKPTKAESIQAAIKAAGLEKK